MLDGINVWTKCWPVPGLHTDFFHKLPNVTQWRTPVLIMHQPELIADKTVNLLSDYGSTCSRRISIMYRSVLLDLPQTRIQARLLLNKFQPTSYRSRRCTSAKQYCSNLSSGGQYTRPILSLLCKHSAFVSE